MMTITLYKIILGGSNKYMFQAPLYQQVKEDIKLSIERGQYLPKEQIPSEPELSKIYSVSRITIRRAVDELCSDGYLIKLQGRGTFVATPRIHRKITGNTQIEGFTQTCEQSGLVASGELVNCQIVPAREDEKRFLQLPPHDDSLIYIQRIRYASGTPILLENQFLPHEEYKDLLEREDLGSLSLFQSIYEISGKKATKSNRRTIQITVADHEQSLLLETDLGSPLFFTNVYFTTEQDEPICIGRQYYVGSRYMFDLQ